MFPTRGPLEVRTPRQSAPTETMPINLCLLMFCCMCICMCICMFTVTCMFLLLYVSYVYITCMIVILHCLNVLLDTGGQDAQAVSPDGDDA